MNKNYKITFFCVFIIILCYVSWGLYSSNFSKISLKEALYESAKIPADHWDNLYKDMKIKDKYKVVFVVTHGGEYNYAECFKYAAERMGWQVRLYNKQINTYDREILEFDPDFILYAVHSDHDISTELMAHRSRKYLNSHVLAKYIIDAENPYTITEKTKRLIFPFHGIFTIPQEVDLFQKIFQNANKLFNGIGVLPFTPALSNEPSEPINLMWCGMGWDKFRGSENYKKFIKLLSENISMKVYGPYSYLYYLAPNIYDGFTPSGMEQINAIRKNGIYLLTHTDGYLEAGVPTSRIFEALTANVVIISDKHPFAIENFGDNFLYFDQDADSETMYKQVKAHYDWIKANPEEAKAMADRAHRIFLEKFTVEKDLIRMAKMHEYVLKQEKEMGLNYPLAY